MSAQEKLKLSSNNAMIFTLLKIYYMTIFSLNQVRQEFCSGEHTLTGASEEHFGNMFLKHLTWNT